jgi:tetratricopeptide (TPR) repeat protein
MTRLALVLTLLLVAAPAAADTPYELYAAGKYEEAIRAGSDAGDAPGYATAARAAMAIAAEKAVPCMECLQRAEKLARKAITVDGRNVAGRVYLAATLGYEARIVGLMTAKMRGYPDEAKVQLDKALSLDPDDPWALAARGGWNVEVVRAGGAFLANMIYGATLKAGFADFDKAFRVEPDNIALRYQYALSLSALDIETYRRQVEDVLRKVVKTKPATEYERFARWRAQELVDALRDDDMPEFRRLLKRDQGYP